MKTPKKSVKKPVVKGKGQETDNSKKTKLKPVSAKETKNWKNKLDDEDDDLELNTVQDDSYDVDDLSSQHAFDDHYEEDEDRY